MKRWMLSDSDVLRLMLEAGIRPGRGSPLRTLEIPPEEEVPSAEKPEAALIQAMSCIARPDIVLGMVLYAPTVEPDYTWFYARERESHFASHRDVGGNGHEIVAPLDPYLLVDSARSALASGITSTRFDIALVLDRDEFMALAAIADLMQERGLISLLKREPPGNVRFSATDIVATCNPSRPPPDARWMIPRATLIAPTGLSFSEEDLRKGLESLVRRDQAAREGGFYTPGSELGPACSLLGACSGLCALSLRRRSEARGGDTHWRHRHVAGLRGAEGSLWLFEFRNIIADAFEVALASASESTIYERISETILQGMRPSSVPEAPREKVPERNEP